MIERNILTTINISEYQERVLFEENDVKYKVVKYPACNDFEIQFLYKDIIIMANYDRFSKKELIKYNDNFITISKLLAKLRRVKNFKFVPLRVDTTSIVNPEGKEIIRFNSSSFAKDTNFTLLQDRLTIIKEKLELQFHINFVEAPEEETEKPKISQFLDQLQHSS